MLTHTFPSGLKLEVPEGILILEDFGGIKKDTHYSLKLGRNYSGDLIFDVTHKNGKDITRRKMYLSLYTVLHLVYKPVTLEQFSTLKAFI